MGGRRSGPCVPSWVLSTGWIRTRHGWQVPLALTAWTWAPAGRRAEPELGSMGAPGQSEAGGSGDALHGDVPGGFAAFSSLCSSPEPFQPHRGDALMLLLSLQPPPGLSPVSAPAPAAVPPGASQPPAPWPGPCRAPRSGFVGVTFSAAPSGLSRPAARSCPAPSPRCATALPLRMARAGCGTKPPGPELGPQHRLMLPARLVGGSGANGDDGG